MKRTLDGAKAVITCFSLRIFEDTWGSDSGWSGGDGRAEGVRAVRRAEGTGRGWPWSSSQEFGVFL